MALLAQRLSYLLELGLTFVFVVLVAPNQVGFENYFLDVSQWQPTARILAKFIPLGIFASAMSNFFVGDGFDSFFRKHIFSLVVLLALGISWGDEQFTFWLSIVHWFSSTISLYEFGAEEKRRQSRLDIGILYRFKLNPGQIVLISFAALVLAGSILLGLPISSSEGGGIPLMDAIFTATSAICVTGLSTLGLTEHFSLFGQIIVLVLIQIGGLGIMTLSSSLTLLLGKSLGMKEKMVMQGVLEISSLEDLLSMIADILRYTIIIEFWGAVILAYAFSMEGHDLGQAVYLGIFHSISAFCNAGFSLFPNSLEGHALSPLVHGTIAVLITLGGLGFVVMKESLEVIRKRRRIVDLGVHSKVVLATSLGLTLGGAMLIFFSEFLHALDGYGLWGKIQISLFQSVTLRTAGFNSIALGDLHSYTIYLMAIFMFIGASPGSTGGGIKTSTFAILIQSVRSTLSGDGKVEFLRRSVPNAVVVRSIALIFISLITVSFFVLLMMGVQSEHDFLSIFFEVVSAFGTVGLSLGLTPELSSTGKILITVLMFIGRVGPLTLALAVGQRRGLGDRINYPDGRLMIG